MQDICYYPLNLDEICTHHGKFSIFAAPDNKQCYKMFLNDIAETE